ncbi:MAG: bacteriohemerythrin [Lysobacterales bacterium]
MAQIEWTQEFSVGNAKIDQEHESLIAQINHLYEELNQPLDTSTIESMLTDIQTDISAHFALEELLMQEANYAEFEDHKRDHERLLDQIQDMIFHFAEDPDSGRELLANRLSDWFSHHFKGFDARLHNQLG